MIVIRTYSRIRTEGILFEFKNFHDFIDLFFFFFFFFFLPEEFPFDYRPPL